MDVVTFRNQHFFLSNFYLSDIKYEGTYEHLFQSEKCAKQNDKEIIRNAATPKMVKIYGRSIKMRSDWECVKAETMEKILRLKFNDLKLGKLLKETGDVQLIEQNYWHDTFWGVCTCSKHKRTGLNKLGFILMKIRDEMK